MAIPERSRLVAGHADWESRQPYGLPFFNDDAGQIRPGIIVMPAGAEISGLRWDRTSATRRRAVTGDCSRHTLTAQAASLAPVLRTEVSETLGRAIQNWR
jgi:hypothetical protein